MHLAQGETGTNKVTGVAKTSKIHLINQRSVNTSFLQPEFECYVTFTFGDIANFGIKPDETFRTLVNYALRTQQRVELAKDELPFKLKHE